jgi:hypothetical protein
MHTARRADIDLPIVRDDPGATLTEFVVCERIEFAHSN